MTPDEITQTNAERDLRLSEAAKRLDDAGWARVADRLMRDVEAEFGGASDAMKIALMELMDIATQRAATTYGGRLPLPILRFIKNIAADPERREVLTAPPNLDHAIELPERGRRMIECLLRVIAEDAVIEEFEN